MLELLNGGDGDLHLGGRGLILLPSLFTGDIPLVLTNSSDPGERMLLFAVTGAPAVDSRLWAARNGREGGCHGVADPFHGR